MEGGFAGISIPSGLIPSPSSLISTGTKALQDQASAIAQSDTVQQGIQQGRQVATKLGVQDAYNQGVQRIETATGVSFSPPADCPPDRIDTPMVSDVLISTAENPCKANGIMNSLIGYVVVDSKNPSDYDKKNKNKLWYISISTSALLIGLGILYGQIDK